MKNHKQQLKVGNILHHIGLGTCKVLGIYNDGNIHICDIKDNSKQHLVLEQFTHRLEEVPLSFREFINLGFVNAPKREWYDLIIKEKKIGISINVNSGKVAINLSNCWDTLPFKKIKFIHELQNFVYEYANHELGFSEA